MKNILYSNFYSSERFEEMKNILADIQGRPAYDVPESDIWDAINDQDNDDWRDCQDLLANIDATAFVLCATVYSNYPSFYGYTTRPGCYKLGDDIIRMLNDLCADSIEIYTENRRLYCKYAHHDGGGSFEIRAVNDRGREMYDRWLYYDGCPGRSRADVLDLIFNQNFYSKRINIAA